MNEFSAEQMRVAADAASAANRKDNPPRNTDRRRREEYIEHISGVSAAEVAREEDEGGWPYWERIVDIPDRVLEMARYQRFGLDLPAMEAALCDRLRDIVGNPYRSVTVPPEWRTQAILALAQGIVTERAFDRLPALADALEKVGCSDSELLTHCRQPRVHVLGCWVVDLLLGYSWRDAGPFAAPDTAGM
ncbi:hypothetical protein [Fimbriiglobus ruber]|uniref:Uncharacterized protein n=1 Tax=Fimbriiglobus ruber TaxID=1908690 RepID=A0A225DVQ2_9BACT|nr:hypothetical protein [Fimbriiglobus ruber]OWK45620.1 hypothetical protein FRUB_01951 [Fimbriiglobus ruber]